MLKIEVIGNLGADCVLRSNDRGSYITFDVADSEKYVDGAGNAVERTTWVSCSYNGRAEKVAPYLTKGAKVFVRGRLISKVYKSSTGEWRAALQCLCDDLVLCGSNNNGKSDAPF